MEETELMGLAWLLACLSLAGWDVFLPWASGHATSSRPVWLADCELAFREDGALLLWWWSQRAAQWLVSQVHLPARAGLVQHPLPVCRRATGRFLACLLGLPSSLLRSLPLLRFQRDSFFSLPGAAAAAVVLDWCCVAAAPPRVCSSWSLLIFVGFCFAVVVWMGPPAASIQSLLIQGRGKYNCSLDLPPGGSAATSSPDCLQCNATNPACAPFVLPVQPGKTYRLRIGSMATLSSLNFKIEVNPFSILRTCALPGLTEAFSDCKTLGSRAELQRSFLTVLDSVLLSCLTICYRTITWQ